jgi:hypothetical protein
MANEQRRIGLLQRDNLGLVSFQFATALPRHLGAFKLASAHTFTLARNSFFIAFQRGEPQEWAIGWQSTSRSSV